MFSRVVFKVSYKQLRGDSVDNKNKNLVLTVVNGVAKWVDVRDATERFTGLRQEDFVPRHRRGESGQESHVEELE